MLTRNQSYQVNTRQMIREVCRATTSKTGQKQRSMTMPRDNNQAQDRRKTIVKSIAQQQLQLFKSLNRQNGIQKQNQLNHSIQRLPKLSEAKAQRLNNKFPKIKGNHNYITTTNLSQATIRQIISFNMMVTVLISCCVLLTIAAMFGQCAPAALNRPTGIGTHDAPVLSSLSSSSILIGNNRQPDSNVIGSSLDQINNNNFVDTRLKRSVNKDEQSRKLTDERVTDGLVDESTIVSNKKNHLSDDIFSKQQQQLLQLRQQQPIISMPAIRQPPSDDSAVADDDTILLLLASDISPTSQPPSSSLR